MPIEPNQLLLHYRLIEKLGQGGMGVVWKALDTTLDRTVAIKVLPAQVSADAERMARFEREARLLASLDHPGIATIHGLLEAQGTRFIVMEYVRGEDLAVRLARGALPLDEALGVARQVAEALEVAHEQGIVHRDLKPANLMLDGDRVRVLDFGLAKALAPDASGSGAQPSVSPTITSAQTRSGVIMGTAAYMSPEQARGKPVDRRADIWAFGCVLYEALSGKIALAGETVSDTLVAVLSGEPDWSALPAATPPDVRHLLKRCLEKDARRRLRDIGEARLVLEDAIAGKTGAAVAAPAQAVVPTAAKPSSRAGRWALVGAVAALTFVAGWLLRRPSSGAAPVEPDRSIRRLTFDAGLEQEPALSPDGNYIAYTTNRAGNLDIEVLPLSGGTVSRITSHAADDSQPAWSPDGTRLAFVSARDHESGLLVSSGGLGANSRHVTSQGGDIFITPALGGVATKLVDGGAYPTWAPDSSAIAFQANRDGHWRIWRIPTSGGEPVQLTSGDDLRLDFHPAWSPDGRFIAYGSSSPLAPRGLYVVPAEGGEPVRLFEGMALAPAWAADGKSLYFASDRTATQGVLNLWLVPFDPSRPDLQRPRRVTFGTGSDIGASPSTDGRTIAFATVQIEPQVWALDVATRELRPITDLDGYEDSPHLNVDGRRLVFETNRTGSRELWVRDLSSGSLEPVVTTSQAQLPRWSPDGGRIAFASIDEKGRTTVAVQRSGAATRETIGGAGTEAATGLQWSPDGTRLVGSDQEDLWLHTLGGESKLLVENGSFGTWSPDGTEIAYQRDTGQDRRELWVVPASGGEPRVLVPGDVHLSHPQWNPVDPDSILVVIDHLELGVVRVSTGKLERITEFASSTVQVDYPSWSPDGKTAYFSLARRRGDLYLIAQ